MRSVSPVFLVVAGVVALSGAVVGCSSAVDSEPWQTDGGSNDSGAAPQGDGPASGTDSGVAAGDGAPAIGAHDGGAPDSAAHDSSAGAETGTVTSDDGFGASRTVCINKINALRATDTAVALQPYTLENTDTIDTCVDTQASTDQGKNSAHYAFINNDPSCTWGNATGFAQSECETGYGTSPSGIEQCLQDMWDESLKPNCAGCVGCTAFGGACPNCDYSGTLGYECGHYVNMSAPDSTMVACGFAGAAPSSSNGWAVQNFE